MRKRLLTVLAALLCLALTCALAEAPEIEAPVPELEPVDLTDDFFLVEDFFVGAAAEAAEAASAEDEAFPDPVFRAYVLENYDRDGDGTLSAKEAQKVKTLDVSGLGITSLAGLERFTKLTALNCAGNDLSEIDLSGNKSLERLICNDTLIRSVDLGYTSKLSKTAQSVCPTLEDQTMVYRKSKKVMLALPEGTAISLKGQTFFDPGADFSLAAEEATLGVGQKVALIQASGYPLAYLTLTTSNKKVVSLSKGVAKAAKAGEAEVTVATFDGKYVKTCRFTVLKAPSKVTLSDKKLTMGVDMTWPLTASVPEDSLALWTWSSNKPLIASVEDGLVRALSPGKATIKVKTYNGKSQSCTVTVVAKPTSIALDADELGLIEDETYALGAILNKGEGGSVTFSSQDESVATVDPVTGLVTAVGKGTTTITAQTYNGCTASCAVTVLPGPVTLEIEPEAILIVGHTLKPQLVALSAEGEDVSAVVSYKSSNSKVASVDASGTVTALKMGKATITAYAANGKSAQCAVTVGVEASSIRLNKSSLYLKYDPETETGAESQLTYTLNSGAIATVTYESSDEDVATVDPSGKVTALSVGSCVITATTDNGLCTASCAVTVVEKKASSVIVVAHRGGISVAAENTLEAFRHSAELGADMIELDVRNTSDHYLVVNHDAKIESHSIASNKYAKLKKYKSDLCTFDEALDVIEPTGLLLQVELKDGLEDVAATIKAVKDHGMEDRVYYISFEKSLLRQVRKLEPEAKLGFIFHKSIPSDLASFVDELDISALMVKYDLLTQSFIDTWHDRGLLINVWTVDGYSSCKKWIDMGVDFITSNYPEYADQARND